MILGRRMIDDMTFCNMSPNTEEVYVYANLVGRTDSTNIGVDAERRGQPKASHKIYFAT